MFKWLSYSKCCCRWIINFLCTHCKIKCHLVVAIDHVLPKWLVLVVHPAEQVLLTVTKSKTSNKVSKLSISWMEMWHNHQQYCSHHHLPCQGQVTMGTSAWSMASTASWVMGDILSSHTNGFAAVAKIFCTDCTMYVIIPSLVPMMNCKHFGHEVNVDDAGAYHINKIDTACCTLMGTKFRKSNVEATAPW